MYSEDIIRVNQLTKTYRLYSKPLDRLWEAFGFNRTSQSFNALSDVTFQLKRGEVMGVVGRNGAGKSTLLQLLCGTLLPTQGSVEVKGRIAALLELGAGFNPEFSGRENVYLNASILGLSKSEIDARFDDMIAFSELNEFIDQPVKTYSSGMLVRLAFAVATSVEPDILIIDEALSVGDGVFAKKSFDRIMQLRDAGVTILFCSHALYQIEALCDRALWLHQGQVKALGSANQVCTRYQEFLSQLETAATPVLATDSASVVHNTQTPQVKEVSLNTHTLRSEQDDLLIQVMIHSPESNLVPTIGILISNAAGIAVTSFTTQIDGITLGSGDKEVNLLIPKIPLFKGNYTIDVFVLCDQAIHVYQHIRSVVSFDVTQEHLAIGVVNLPHQWVLGN